MVSEVLNAAFGCRFECQEIVTFLEIMPRRPSFKMPLASHDFHLTFYTTCNVWCSVAAAGKYGIMMEGWLRLKNITPLSRNFARVV